MKDEPLDRAVGGTDIDGRVQPFFRRVGIAGFRNSFDPNNFFARFSMNVGNNRQERTVFLSTPEVLRQDMRQMKALNRYSTIGSATLNRLMGSEMPLGKAANFYGALLARSNTLSP